MSSFSNLIRTAVKGAQLAKPVEAISTHFDDLVRAVKAGGTADGAVLSEARASYKLLMNATPEADRSSVAREFLAQASREFDGDLNKIKALKDALRPDDIVAKIEKTAGKDAARAGRAAASVIDTVSNLRPQTTQVETLDKTLATLRRDLASAGLLDTSGTTKPRAAKQVADALGKGESITAEEFRKFSAAQRAESLGAERGRLVTQIERNAASGQPVTEEVFDRLGHLRADRDYPKPGRGQTASTSQQPADILADLKAGRAVDESQLETMRKRYTSPPAPQGSVVNGLSTEDVAHYGSTLDPSEALKRFPAPDDQARWLAYYSHEMGPKISANIRDGASRLESLARTKDHVNIEEIVGTLRNHLRDASQERLVVDSSQLGRAEFSAPRDITTAMKNGQSITENELNRLRDFFVKYHGQKGDRTSTPAAPYALGGGKFAMAAQAIDKATTLFTQAVSDAPKKAGRNALAEWETGTAPSFVTRLVNGALDRPGTVMSPIIAAAAGIGGYSYLQKIADLHDLGRTQTIAANFLLPEEPRLTGTAAEKNDVVGAMYARMVIATNNNQKGADFFNLTKEITGVDLSTEKLHGDPTKSFSDVPLKMDTAEQVELFRKLIEKSQSATAGTGAVTTDGLLAYRLALSTIVGATTPTDDSTKTFEAWSQRTAELMRNSPNLAKGVIKAYYGEDIPLDDDRLLISLSSRRGVSTSEKYFPAMADYLVKTGKLDKVETAMDPKSLATFIQNKIEAGVASSAEQNAVNMRTKPSSDAPQTQTTIDLNEVFNGLTADNTFGMKGKGNTLKEAYQKAQGADGAVDPAKLDKSLEQAGLSTDQRRTVAEWTIQR